MQFHITAQHMKRSHYRDHPDDTRPPLPWTPRRLKVKLAQLDSGEWRLYIGRGEGLPVTDAELSLWMDLQEARGQR